jgi:molybdopterin-guanine dinucleotide biosynthesis protein A
MGRDKATLKLRGDWLWERQFEILRELGPEAVWISARTMPEWCPPGVEVVLDKPPSRGPLSGINAAMGRLKTTHLIALAVDMPHMTTAHLGQLWAAARAGCGVVPVKGDRFEPLCAIYPREAAWVFSEALAGGRATMQDVVRELVERNLVQTRDLSESETGLYHNVNRPEDL